jgi:hypothetical protein
MSIVSFLGRNESHNLKDDHLSKKPRIEENIDEDIVTISSDDENDDSTYSPTQKQSKIKKIQKKPSNKKIRFIYYKLNFHCFYVYKQIIYQAC